MKLKISNIARAGLNEVRPLSIGEATRISTNNCK